MSYQYHQLLKYVYFEGYVDSYEEAENLLEEMSDEEFEEIIEKYAYKGGEPLPPSHRRALENIIRMNRGDYSVPPGGTASSTRNKSARKPNSTSTFTQKQPRKKRKLEFEVRENFESVVEYLFMEGYADNYDSAIAIYESMSEEWLDTILEVKGRGRVPFTGNTMDRGMEINPSDKLYRKKIKIEMDMEDEEDRIRAKNRAEPEHRDSGPDPEEEDDDTRSRKSKRKATRRDAAANREMRTSPRMQRLRQRHQTLSDVDDRLRYGR